jgi:hypothetical protein
MNAATISLTAESLWNLEALSGAPIFRFLETTQPIHALLYEGLPYRGRKAEVFAWYANPVTIRRRGN